MVDRKHLLERVRSMAEDRTARGPRPPFTRHVIILVVLGALLASATAYSTLVSNKADPDMFWHIANGREMAQTDSIPQYDGLSWYGAEKHLRVSTQEWLYDFTVYQVFRLGGFRLVYVGTALLFGILFVAVYMLAVARTNRHIPALMVASLAIIGTIPNTAPRPQGVSFILLVLTAILLERRWWFAVLPVVVLAANVHGGSFPIFLVVIAYYSYHEKPWLVAAAAACVVANPQTTELLWFPIQGTFTPMVDYIQEFRAPTLPDTWYLFLTLGGLALLLRNKRIPLDTGLLSLALIVLSLISARYGAYVFLLAVPLLVPYILSGPMNDRDLDAAGKPLSRPERAPAPRWLKLLLVVEMTFGVVLKVALSAQMTMDVHEGYPADAVAYIKLHQIERMYNFYNDGGYLLYQGVPTLIDGRAIPFGPMLNEGENLFFEYMDVASLKSDYRAFLRSHDIEYLLLPKSTLLYRALVNDQEVRAVYEDATHVVMQTDPSMP